jgi:cadmium resistance protein CadD (predicted permease)
MYVAYLPFKEKHLIQTSYIRFRELTKELPELRTKIAIGQVAHWGGLTVVVLDLIRVTLGHSKIPQSIGVIALFSLVFGWAYKSDQLKKENALLEEEVTIQSRMKEIGVQFASGSGNVTVYSGLITAENVVSPLSDDSYR